MTEIRHDNALGACSPVEEVAACAADATLRPKGMRESLFFVFFCNQLYFFKAVLVEWKVEISHRVSSTRVVHLLEFVNLHQHIITTQKSMVFIRVHFATFSLQLGILCFLS